mmetsp:Transcript_14426/g.39078  ORF Transcript_14426/g.39078 Transcript_14426/m.39078 type:complete len:216 (+) Transcript_14426:317-964(+)
MLPGTACASFRSCCCCCCCCWSCCSACCTASACRSSAACSPSMLCSCCSIFCRHSWGSSRSCTEVRARFSVGEETGSVADGRNGGADAWAVGEAACGGGCRGNSLGCWGDCLGCLDDIGWLSGWTIRLNVRLMRGPIDCAGDLRGTVCCHCCCTLPFMTSKSPGPRVNLYLSLLLSFFLKMKSRAAPKESEAMVGSSPYSFSLSACHPTVSLPSL